MDDPFATTEKILTHYPEANTQLINAHDMQNFLLLCQRRGQKPVPFVPSHDENFEFWFKKDSLWQPEDLEAVVDQDVGRTCILQGPMAAKYSTVVNEPIQDILDNIHNGHIAALTTDVYGGDESAIPIIEYFGSKPITSRDGIGKVHGLTVFEEGGKSHRDNHLVHLPLPDRSFSAAQFTQAALTLTEKASFEYMKSRGLIQRDSGFAGHSLGEYSALAALAEVMPIESLVSVVFYRGLNYASCRRTRYRGKKHLLYDCCQS